MKKKFSKILGVGLALVLACSFGLVPAAPVSAVITAGPTIEPVLGDTDDVAGKENAAYQITYTQDTIDTTVDVITVTFPEFYVITDGGLGKDAVKNGDGSESGFVTIRAMNRLVDNVVGDPVGRTIAITLANSFTYQAGDAVSFQIVLGIKNPTLIGEYGPTDLTVDDDATGNDPVIAGAAVTIIADVATQVLVEDAVDGTGEVVIAQEVISGDTLTVYAITRDVYGNFIANVAADSWSLVNINGGVVAEDLVGSETSATFTGALVGTAEIHAVSGILPSVDSGTITVTVGEADQVVMTPETDTTHVAGTDITFTAELQDAAGNHIDFTAEGNVTFSGGSGGWGDNALAAGLITCVYTTSTTVVIAEGLTATEQIAPPAGDQADTSTITTLAGTATQVLVEDANDGTGAVQAATDVVSGASITVYAITRDANDNFVANVAADWSLVNTTGEVVDGDLLGEGTSATFTGGLVGTAVIHVASGGLIPGDSGIITVIVGTAAKLAFFQEPTETVAGETISPSVTVEIVDAGGNRVTTADDLITIDIGFNAGEGTLSGTETVFADAGLATFDDLSINKTGVGYTLVATVGGLTLATSDAFDITPGTKVALAFVDEPITTGAGEIISVSVEIIDSFGNRTLDMDTITIAAIGPSELFGTKTVPAVDGLATFDNLWIEEMGVSYTLEATADGLTEDTSASFDITVGTAASLAFVAQPTETVAGETISTVTVEILDAYGNQTEDTDTITIAAIGPSELLGTLEVAADAGLATFSNLQIEKTGSYTLEATADGLDLATSAAFDITPDAKVGLAFVEQPTETVAGVIISPSVTVEIVDDFGNRVTTAINEITIAATGPGTLDGTLMVPAIAGMATFSDLFIEKTGSYTLEAAPNPNGLLTPATSGEFDITPAAVFAIDVAAPASIVVGAGENNNITATVTDEYGNLVADETVVTFETTRGMVSPVTALTASGEAKTTLSAGSRSGTAMVTATTANLVSGEATVEFTPLMVVDHITVIASEASIPANGTSTSTITVTLVDEHGNTVPTAGATVHLETTAGGLSLESGATEAGVFNSTLTSSTSPITAEVTAHVGGMFSGSVTVDFYPLPEPVPPPEQIELQAGWNAISLPLIPDNPLITVVLDGVEGVEVVWAYDPVSRPADPWFSYSPGAPSDLEEMEDGLGYWVKMSGSAILTITGVVEQPEPPESPKTYPVVAGWNFIGFKSLNPMLYDDYLVNIAGDYSVILGYSDGDFYNVHPIEPPPDLMPGSGYWIWMTAEGIIVTLD